MKKMMTALALAMIFGATAFAQDAAEPAPVPETPAEITVQAEAPRAPRGRRGQRPQLTEEQKAELKARFKARMTCKTCGKMRKFRRGRGPRPDAPKAEDGKTPDFCGCPRPQLTEEQKAEMKARFEARRTKCPKGKKGPRGPKGKGKGKGPRGPQAPAPEAPAPAPEAPAPAPEA